MTGVRLQLVVSSFAFNFVSVGCFSTMVADGECKANYHYYHTDFQFVNHLCKLRLRFEFRVFMLQQRGQLIR